MECRGSHGSVTVHLFRGSYYGKMGREGEREGGREEGRNGERGAALHGSSPFLLLFLCGSAFVSLIMLIPA